ncbi:hypothetical protein DFH09DRAFT_901793, partial [Mycena vulgaris]
QGGLSHAVIFNRIDGSLARLQPTYLDVLIIHAAADPTTRPWRAVQLRRGGDGLVLCAANLPAWQVADMYHGEEIKGWMQFPCIRCRTAPEYDLVLVRPFRIFLMVHR